EESMEVTGSCHCGEVEFEARIDPNRVGICHCTDCQTFSGSAFRISVLVPGEDFRLMRGNPSIYAKMAASGKRRELAFCGRCGTHVYGTTAGTKTPSYSVRVGIFTQRRELRPVAQVWCRSALPWLRDLANVHEISTQ
ncbi:GFA family protein, partial [Myxococcota bacterium]|nr:GFA family protein [Myxococcota bacterium]